MNKLPSLFLGAAATVALACAIFSPPPSAGQAAAAEDPAIAQLVIEVVGQHDKIVANQQAIEIKVNAIAENLRVARIYVSRGGGRK